MTTIETRPGFIRPPVAPPHSWDVLRHRSRVLCLAWSAQTGTALAWPGAVPLEDDRESDYFFRF